MRTGYLEHKQQLPQWFQFDHAREAFQNTYPFHPTVISVFERKWRVLPRFQQTRGALRLLALWVSRVYQEGFKGGHRDPLIGLGSARWMIHSSVRPCLNNLVKHGLRGRSLQISAGRRTPTRFGSIKMQWMPFGNRDSIKK